MKVRIYQYVDEEIRYIEDYTIGDGADFATIDDLVSELNELVGLAIDRYEIIEV